MRLFIGIPLGHKVTNELNALCGRLRSSTDGLRWSPPESWHITLQFLGSTSPEQFACLKSALADVRSAPVPVRLGRLDTFDRVGVFLVEVELTPELVALQQRVLAATAPCGFEAEDRPYRPHITLARTKGRDGGRQLKALQARTPGQPAFTGFTAREFLLYESHLGPGGAKYEVRQRFPLAVE